MTEAPAGSVAVLDLDAAPESTALLRGVRVMDRHTLRCTNRGSDVLLLHNNGPVKPWQRWGWTRTRRHAYVELLVRLLTEGDLAVTVPDSEIPFFLRADATGRASLAVLDALNRVARPVARWARDQVDRRRLGS